MKEYTNPFYTLREAIAILKSSGADPFKADGPYTSWQDSILSITTQNLYSGGYHHSVLIHVNGEGFEEVVRLTDSADKVVRAYFVEEYDEYSFELSPGLKIFKLEQVQSREADE